MLKRILTVAAGAGLGTLLSAGALHLAWSFFPDRQLNRSVEQMRNVLRLVGENYVEQDRAAYDRLTREALSGLVSSLDPHSAYLEPTDYQLLESDLDGNFGGIGVQVEMRDGKVVVIAPMAGTPGERAGILRGDEIRRVDRRELAPGINMDEVIRQLRGKPGTQVTVGLFRPGTGQPVEVVITREIIRQQSVRTAEIIAPEIGYIHLVDFSAQTVEQLQEALRRLAAAGMRQLVLDLRNNPGGLLQAAVGVGSLFLPRDELVVFTQGRRVDRREDFKTPATGEWSGLPVVVLVNSGSASAAEVVTGALKDHSRAVVVGERTFGKGSVQSLFRLRQGGGLRLTTAHYYTPSGTSIHEKGILPHVEVVMSPEEDNRLRIQRLRQDIRDPADFAQRFGFTPVEDRQLQAALDLIRSRQVLAQRAAAL
ncbi:MAG: S41 family peptidase [Opitutaceae bacterium]|nr:S41 family peptidase [Opitutaceae bacterium]